MSVDYESVAKLAQKYIEKPPAVILGCGSSIQYGLPSMSDLAEALTDRIDSEDKTWETFKTKLDESKNLENALQEVTVSPPVLDLIVNNTWQITSEKDLELFDAIVTGTTSLALARLFEFLLRTANPQLSVVTTNYDRLAEYAANTANADV